MKKTKRLILAGVLGLFSLSSFAQSQSAGSFVEGDIIVDLLEESRIREIISSAPVNYGVKIDRQLSRPANIWLLKYDHNAVSHDNVSHWLYNTREVEASQRNYYLDLRATIPNDGNFSSQWHHVNTGQTGGTNDADIDSDLAWDITTGGTTANGHDIVVCMIESGYLDHPDLTGNRWVNTAEIPNNGVDDDNNGYVDDYDGWNPLANNDDYGTGGHGTQCLGMIGAKGNNGSQVAGANWDVKLMVIGGYSVSTDANAIEAYTYPLEMRQLWNSSGGTQGAFVVATSSSWGIDGENPANHPVWCNYYDVLGQNGILNVGATTNSNLDVDVAGDMPTACASNYMIGVGRSDHNDNSTGGYGDQTIELAAPGENVATTLYPSGITTSAFGTSFACPLTAGVIGLAYSIPCTDFMSTVMSNPQAGADMVLQALLDGVDQKPQLASKFITGGRLNSKNTLDELMAVGCNGTVCFAPSATNTSNVGDNAADVNFTAFASANSTTLYWREVGAASWTTVSNATSPVNLTGLTPCTDYEYYFESDCGGGNISNPSNTQNFTTTGCGACVDLTYCTSTGANDEEYIDEFVLDTYTNNSGPDAGYGDFTAVSTIPLTINTAYNFTMTPGWGAGGQYDEYLRIWVDLDHSGTFESNEMLFDQGAANQNVQTGTITIPATATTGITRMRVYMAYDDGNALPDMCASYTYGETEDYCVEITSGPVPNCGLIDNGSVVQPACAGIDDGSIAVNISGGSGNYSYDWGAAGGNVSSISNLTDGSYSVVVTDVTAGCDTTINYTLSYTTTVNVAVNSTNVSCNGMSDGSATATATGGTSYTYQWSAGGPANATYSGLSAGTYTVDVTDVSGCTGQSSVTITEPAADQASFGANIDFLNVTFNNTSTSGSYAWDFGDGNTSSSQSPSHSYATPGTYTVCLTVTTNCGTVNTCSDVTVDEDDTGIEENFVDFVQVFPNPAKDEVNFKITHAKLTSVEVVDVVGKVIARYEVSNEITQIDVSNLNDGSYFYRISDESGAVVITDKIVIVK